jgi:hypothetical protein
MAKINEKPAKSPTRDANQKDVKVVKEAKKNVKKTVKEEIMEDVIKLSKTNQEYGLSNKLSVEEIEAILNKYF